jgi:hypothetical protein
MSQTVRKFELRTLWWRELAFKGLLILSPLILVALVPEFPEAIWTLVSLLVLTIISTLLPEPLNFPVIAIKISDDEVPTLELHLRSFRSPVIEDRQILRRTRLPDRIDLVFTPGRPVKSFFLQPVTESVVHVMRRQFSSRLEWDEFNALLENYPGKVAPAKKLSTNTQRGALSA